MSFHEVRFPTSISYGSRGGPSHNTAVVELDSGSEERISRWSSPRATFDVSFGVKTDADLAEVIAFARAREGALHGFRFKDWSDYTTATDGRSAASMSDATLGVGDAVTTTFQLVKTYTSGGTTKTRRIEKPVSGTTLVAVRGVLQTSGYSVNTTTGLVTFTTAPGLGLTVTAGCEFDVPVRFGSEVDEFLEVSLDAYQSGSCPRLTAVEIKNEAAVDEDFFFGGAQSFDPFSQNVSITPNDGRVLVFNPTTALLSVNLPNPSSYQPGGPYFFIANLSGANTFNVVYGSLVVTVPVNGWVTIVLGYDGAGAKTWFGF